jgi:hypothetical protein
MVYLGVTNKIIDEILDLKIKQGKDCGYKTKTGANKKLIKYQKVIKEYFNKSSLKSIRDRNIDDFLYLSRIDH